MMTFEVEQIDEVSVVTICGRLDASNFMEIQTRLLGLVDQGKIKFLLDLPKLSYISSAGIRIFIVMMKRVKPLGGSLAVSRLTDIVGKVFKMAGFHIMFSIFPTREEGIDHLKNNEF